MFSLLSCCCSITRNLTLVEKELYATPIGFVRDGTAPVYFSVSPQESFLADFERFARQDSMLAFILFLFLVLFILINSLQHISISLLLWTYNPGFLSAIFINLPISFLLLRKLVRHKMINLDHLMKKIVPASLVLYAPAIGLIWGLSYTILSITS